MHSIEMGNAASFWAGCALRNEVDAPADALNSSEQFRCADFLLADAPLFTN